MPRRKLCPDCGEKMGVPDYVKIREESQLIFTKIYACGNCEKLVKEKMTDFAEIQRHAQDFNWGSVEASSTLTANTLDEAKTALEMERKTQVILTEIQKTQEPALLTTPFSTSVQPSRPPLDVFMERVNASSDVHHAYLTDPPHVGQHILDKGWQILELHVVPLGRPPYFELEKIFASVEKEGDEISEMIGERIFLKINTSIHLVRIIHSPARLGHV